MFYKSSDEITISIAGNFIRINNTLFNVKEIVSIYRYTENHAHSSKRGMSCIAIAVTKNQYGLEHMFYFGEGKTEDCVLVSRYAAEADKLLARIENALGLMTGSCHE